MLLLLTVARTAARATGPTARVTPTAVGLAIHSVEQLAQALVEQRIHAPASAAAATPLRHGECRVAPAAAAAVVRREAPPRRVKGDERARRLP